MSAGEVTQLKAALKLALERPSLVLAAEDLLDALQWATPIRADCIPCQRNGGEPCIAHAAIFKARGES